MSRKTSFQQFFSDGNNVTVKGSAETILELCGEEVNHVKIEKQYLNLSAKGYRVIALAAR